MKQIVITDPHLIAEPSAWVVKHATRITKNAGVLDLACGSGRHALYLVSLGLQVTALDRDTSILRAQILPANIHIIEADVENAPWPFADKTFDAIVVTNYLHRPLFAKILAALKPSGVLIYETFAAGNEKFGKPSNPDFLLQEGELLETVRGRMRVIAYEDDFFESPKPAMIQRICAIKS
ncbi:MAG: class I SAM-dependent methyltransferase [Burkholderiales bacterium]